MGAAGGDKWADWWIPVSLRADSEQRWRARFLVHSLWLGMAISCGMGCFYVATWVPLLIAQCGVVSVALVVALVSLRLKASFRFSSHLALAGVTVAFAVPLLVERQMDPSGLAWFAVIPFVAVLLLGPRAAWTWVPICLVSVVALYVHPPEWGVITMAPHVPLVRNVMLMFTILVFALSFESQQREVRRELQHANRAKSSFLANMSHELRTPMNGVLGMTEVMLKSELPPESREQLELVQRSGKAMVELVNGILDLARVEAGKLTIERVGFSLERLLDDVTGLYQPVARGKGLSWTMERDAGVPAHVQGDPLRLRQVLGNLVDNAFKFTVDGGVSVRVSLEAGGTRFDVIDSGPGIGPDLARRLFTPFEQADNSTTRRHGGSGLGLALSSQLVSLMGGELTLSSAVDQGARFSFVIPLPPGAAMPVAASLRANTASGPSRGRVLVVDDNRINLTVACALVRAQGFEVISAVDGREALALVSQHAFDFVLMDCHMPVMDGLEATREMRKLPGERLPIVALTAAVLPEELAACLEAGFDECLTKPVDSAALAAMLTARVKPKA